MTHADYARLVLFGLEPDQVTKDAIEAPSSMPAGSMSQFEDYEYDEEGGVSLVTYYADSYRVWREG